MENTLSFAVVAALVTTAAAVVAESVTVDPTLEAVSVAVWEIVFDSLDVGGTVVSVMIA